MNKNTDANHHSQIYIITKLLNIEYLAKHTDNINIKIDHKKLIKRFEFVLKKDTSTVCPICKSNNIAIYTNRSHSYKHGRDNMYSNIITIKYKKYRCNSCHHHFPQTNPIHHYKNMTHELVFSIIDTFQNSIGITVEDVAKQYSLDAKVIRDIIDKCLTKIRKPLPEVLGIDEVYFGKGKYLCVLVDFITGDLVDVLDSRTGMTLNNYFNGIPLEEREKVLFVTLDMTGYYRNYLHKWLPNTNFAVDLFHLKKRFNDALKAIINDQKSQYRKFFTNKFRRENDFRYWRYYILSKFSYLLYTDNENLKEIYYVKGIYPDREGNSLQNITNGYKQCRWSEVQLLDYMFRITDNYANEYIIESAYNLKERFSSLMKTDYLCKAKEIFVKTNNENTKLDNKYLLEVIKALIYDDLNELIFDLRSNTNNDNLHEIATSLENWSDEIAGTFIEYKRTVTTKRNKRYTINTKLNNGITERVNREIKKIIKWTSNYRNVERTIKIILLKINGDSIIKQIKKYK